MDRRNFLHVASLITGKIVLPANIISAVLNKESDTVDYKVLLKVITPGGGEDQKFTWAHARSAAIPGDPPVVITTMSKKLTGGMDVYHDLYEAESRDMGETWTEPQVIPSLKVYKTGDGYQSMADMWPQWYSNTNKVLNIGTSVFYSNDDTQELWKRKVTYAVYDPETTQWSASKILVLPERGHEGRLLMSPLAGSAQWAELPDGDILLPIFYFEIADEDEQAAMADPETFFSISNLMNSGDLRFASTVVLCTFDGETLTYKELGDEITLNRGRGIYEPSITSFQGKYFLTMRSDKSAYVAKSNDGLHYSPIEEWTFDDGSILGSYNTQQHWVNHSDDLFLVYTRKAANNDEVFRHRAPLFMAQVDVEKLQVIRSTERIVVPNRGVGLGNFGITKVNEYETWITVAEYMREEEVEADNSVFAARIQWSKPNHYQAK